MAAALARTIDVAHLSGAQASSAAVQDALSTATLFHYAGHSDEVSGELFLPLAGGGRLTTSDVLALPLSPERVILSACQAGRVRPSGLAIGMGLVQAFLENGASEVIAPTRPVKALELPELTRIAAGPSSPEIFASQSRTGADRVAERVKVPASVAWSRAIRVTSVRPW